MLFSFFPFCISFFGIWWTFSGEDIGLNTKNIWRDNQNALNDFYVSNNGEIGKSFPSHDSGPHL